jgi:hypothetical protein
MIVDPESPFERVSCWGLLRAGQFRVAVALVLARVQYRVIHGRWKRYYR